MADYTKAQQTVIDANREWNIYDNWWEFVYEQWDEKLESLGIDLEDRSQSSKSRHPTIYFSGFSSQGDGACFEGSLNMALFIKVHSLGKDYPGVAHFADSLSCSITHSGYYYHAYETSFDFEDSIDTDDPEPLRQSINENILPLFEVEWEDFGTAIKDICRGYMDDIYHELEEEYAYLTSDDAVWEAIQDNDDIMNELKALEEEEAEEAA